MRNLKTIKNPNNAAKRIQERGSINHVQGC